MIYKQNFKVSWSENTQEYVGLCPRFPSLSWYDKSAAGALKGIRNLVNEAVKDLQGVEEKTL